MIFIGLDLGRGKRIMTRFKTGSKVEVFGTREVSSGSWYRAEIIHGNGHYYTVKYDIGASCQGSFDRVPRKAIRPCPPPMQVLDWTPGDVVEVFHCFSWKMATVVTALHTGWLLVRLLGSGYELEVSKVDARPRLFLKDDEWNVIGKGSNNFEEWQNVHSLLNIHNVPNSLKRKFKSCYPQSEAPAVQNQKIRVKGKDRRKNQLISILRPSLPVKVDAVASSRAMPVKKCVRLFSEKSVGRESMDGAIGCSYGISLDSRGANSITSSVASCSMLTKNTHEIPQNFLRGPFEENGDYNSDAESFCPNRSEEGNILLPADQKLSEEIHKIELHAYRSIIGALHASGPLSWEQESLLTDLRDSLHISTDEHLMELRSLVSTSTCIPNS